MKNNQSGSALIISIIITMIIILVAIYLLDKIVPFSRDIKGIENGNIAYYKANTALNEALLSMSISTPGYETGSSSVVNGSGIAYQVMAIGTILPRSGKGNSEYSRDWAILAPGKPIQLVLSTGMNWSTSIFKFRVPDLNRDGNGDETLSGGTTLPIINWVLTTNEETLQASGSQIMANNINNTNVSLTGKNGLTPSGSVYTFDSFYTAKCGITNACTLKLSLINPLVLTTNEIAPYLEYQATFNVPVPLQTATVEAQGYAGGFRKNITTRFMQQMTTNEAFDFTVFQ